MKKFMAEFREFIARGNVMDMAVGVIIGTAFNGIVSSFINDVLMPVLGIFLGGVDFSGWVVSLPNFFGGEAIPMKPGVFINTLVNFIILAFVVFMLVKTVNKMRRKKEVPPAPAQAAKPDPQVELLTEIRDLMKRK